MKGTQSDPQPLFLSLGLTDSWDLRLILWERVTYILALFDQRTCLLTRRLFK